MNTQVKQRHEMRKSAVKMSEMDTSHLDVNDVKNSTYEHYHWNCTEHDFERNYSEKTRQACDCENHSVEFLNDLGPDSTLNTDGKMNEAKKDNLPFVSHTIHSNASVDGFYDDGKDELAGFDSREGGGNLLLQLEKDYRATYYYISESPTFKEVSEFSIKQTDEMKKQHLTINHLKDLKKFDNKKDTYSGKYFILEKISQ